jgi:hypothetical protein
MAVTQQMRDEVAASTGLDVSTMGDAQIEFLHASLFAAGGLGELALIGGGEAAVVPDIIGDFYGGPAFSIPQPAVAGGTTQPYYEGEHLPILATLLNQAPEEFVRLQEQMLALGLTSSIMVGQIDDGTRKGFERLFAMANAASRTWGHTLDQLMIAKDQGLLDADDLLGAAEDARMELERTYTRQLPDYATLAGNVRTMFRDVLDRDPTQAEVHLLSDELMGEYQTQQDNLVSLQREQDREVLYPEGEAGAGRELTIEKIDPLARFQESFAARFRPEILSNQIQQGTGSGAAVAGAQVGAAESAAGV